MDIFSEFFHTKPQRHEAFPSIAPFPLRAFVALCEALDYCPLPVYPLPCVPVSEMITTCDFRFVCPVNWDEMADLPDGSGKHCDHCQRPVVTVHTRKEFNAAARRGDCVAVFPEGEDVLPPLSGAPLIPESFRLIGDPDLRPRKK